MIATLTNTQAVAKFGVDIISHFDADALIPVLTAGQTQGDVRVRPKDIPAATTPVPVQGVAVVKGENGGNTHLLLHTPGVFFDAEEGSYEPDSVEALNLGVLTVEKGAEAYLAHPEHGYLGIGSGTYIVRRQRQQADIVEMVRD